MRIRVGHVSLQFTDTDKKTTDDIEQIFDRAVARRLAWIMGTEAGEGAGNTGKELLRIGKAHDYRMWVPSEQNQGESQSTDCWIAVRKDLVLDGWKTGYRRAIPSSKQLYEGRGLPGNLEPQWGPKGLVTVEFQSIPELGEINLGVAHYLTQARSPKAEPIHGVDHWDWNKKLAGVIGGWAQQVAKGNALAFYSGDQNMSDAANDEPQGDTFMGQPLTSLADELKKWQNTGRGPIDVIASYNRDNRVKGQNFTALDDREFPLNTDHFYLEGVFNVEALKR